MSKLTYDGPHTPRPRRKPTVMVDFDGTIAEEDEFPHAGKPMHGVRDALRTLKDAGFEIVVFTCRMYHGDGRPMDEVAAQKDFVERWMRENDVPFSRIEDGVMGKPRADFYIDNKGLNYGPRNDWESIASYIISMGSRYAS